MEEKDYYSILGLTEDDKRLSSDEFNKKLKQSFRKLSMQYHPDRYSTKSEEERKTAEDKFKEISEAYNTLSDEGKRKEYDMKNSGFGFGNDFGDINDIFEAMKRTHGFGDMFTQHNTIQKGEDIRVVIEFDIKDVLNGSRKTVTFKKKVKCKSCKGTGSSDGIYHKCPKCNGTGHIMERTNTPFGFATTSYVCDMCHGKGSIVNNPCPKCNGEGYETINMTETFDVPVGVYDGYAYKIDNIGNECVNGLNGDVIVFFKEKPSKYKRINNDLYAQLEIDFTEALIGSDKEIECPDGTKRTIKIKELSREGDQIIVHGKGIPSNRRVGNFVIVLTLKYPKTLNEHQKEIIRNFYNYEQ